LCVLEAARKYLPEVEGILILLDSALALGSKLEAWVDAVVKKAALALADLMAWFPRLERRTAERVTRVMSYRLFYSKRRGKKGW
jgi:cyanate permease